MTLLSININKFALIRNARGTNYPNLLDVTKKCINYGAQGITVHPRPDERHIKFSDLDLLSDLIKNQKKPIEFNIEGFPSKKFCKIINKIKPDQVTLVPDHPNALTSSNGWNCKKEKKLLKDVVKKFKLNNIRVSIFINPSIITLENLKDINPDRVELYTFDYAHKFKSNQKKSVKPYVEVCKFLKSIPRIGINAGHDLNLKNLGFFLKKIPNIQEVSIGHAIICDAFEFGLQKTIKKYLSIIKNN
tara:strand:- start:779 stop:1516 length:738 start_codon:yes stop_codon:yes gene_type:complete